MSDNNTTKLSSYYKFHSKIYDATRWTFLFGRKEIVEKLPNSSEIKKVGEIGCGTGTNTVFLSKKYKEAHIDGYDLAAPMIALASKKFAQSSRVTFHCKPYEASSDSPRYDVLLASYSLSMINPGFEKVIEDASKDLKKSGVFAVVDFHFSPLVAFRKWMGINHVKMEAHLLPKLEQHFKTNFVEIRSAYFGLWQFKMWIGSPK